DLYWFKGIEARPIAAWAARKALRRRRAPQGIDDATGAAAPSRHLSSDVIFELFGRQLEADEQFKAGALHRRPHLGKAERIDSLIVITCLVLARDAFLNVCWQGRRGCFDLGRRLRMSRPACLSIGTAACFLTM